MLIFPSSKHLLSHHSLVLVYACVSAARIPYTPFARRQLLTFGKHVFGCFSCCCCCCCLLLDSQSLFADRASVVMLLLFASFSPSFAYLEIHTLTQYTNNLIDIWLNTPRSIDSFASIAIFIHMHYVHVKFSLHRLLFAVHKPRDIGENVLANAKLLIDLDF